MIIDTLMPIIISLPSFFFKPLNLYNMIQFPKFIWMYWENRRFSKKPPYLQLCLETIHKHSNGYKVLLLNEQSISQYLDIPKKIFKIKDIAHRADYFRFHLLYQYGGIWLDADTILLRNIGETVDPYIESYDYVGYGRERGKPSIGFMASQKGCKLLEKHIEIMEDVLKEKNTTFFNRSIELVWTEIGYDIFWPLSKNYPYFHHEFKMFAPIYWENWELFNQPTDNMNQYLTHNPFMIMLYNDFMNNHLKSKSRAQILSENTLLSSLIKHSLKE